jgi:hypothetical protein
MENEENALEILWGQLLSRQAAQVRAAYAGLEPGERQAVVAHLRRMVSEAGWQPEQRRSARAALRALDSLLTKTP